MLDIKDFSINDNEVSFDFRGLFIKIISYWPWFFICLLITFTAAYQTNIRKGKLYSMETLISIKEESNPLFTSNTSLVFNWGGTSDQVSTITSVFKSRSHNELVVDKLQFYIDYLEQGKYNLLDVYGLTPFTVEIDKEKSQLANELIKIKFISANEYELSVTFLNGKASVVYYLDNSYKNISVPTGDFVKIFKVGKTVSLPFLHWKLKMKTDPGFYIGKEYFIRFNDFDATVSDYKDIDIDSDDKGGSLITLGMVSSNKARMVDYLNATVNTLIKKQLEDKNRFATNTIRFIDSTLVAMESQLKETEGELKSFRQNKNIFDIEAEGSTFSDKFAEYDVVKEETLRKITYYNSLKSYLNKTVDYSKLPAPTVAGIEDPNIVLNVSKLIVLSSKRSEMMYAVKSEQLLQDFDVQMEAVKNVLLENISNSKSRLENDLSSINKKISQIENTVKRLPDDQQELIKIKRKYDLNEKVYSAFLQKRSEADIVKAANLSDIHFIDPAKEVSASVLSQKTSVNYILALFLGILVPLIVILAIFFLNNTILNAEDIHRLTTVPLIGIVGVNTEESDLTVFDKPKSAMSESFRGIRSSLQFLYKEQEDDGSKVLVLTSSISGEGKTFCSVNIATVFALSQKKTIIVGLDLRKPKLYKVFDKTTEFGVVNYLINQKKIDEIIIPTKVPYLDIIFSGPIPPNPSELILNERLDELIEELKTRYDYIILDTPPVGLVSDAMEISQFADVTLYIVRQNYTKKEMVSFLNNRIKRGELKNASIVLNGFENKAKYGSSYGYYGYGNYHEEEAPKGLVEKTKFLIKNKKIFKK